MCNLAIKIPDEVLYDTKMNVDETTQFVRQMTALGYYTKRKVSIGYCSRIAGMTETEFLQFLGDNQVSVFRFEDDEELLRDIENA